MRIPRPWQATGRHYELMLATTMAAIVAVPLLWSLHLYAGAVGALLCILTLLVQWLCIEPPDVSEDDLH